MKTVLMKQIYYMKQLVSYYYAVRVRILGNVALRRVSLQCALKPFDVFSPPFLLYIPFSIIFTSSSFIANKKKCEQPGDSKEEDGV